MEKYYTFFCIWIMKMNNELSIRFKSQKDERTGIYSTMETPLYFYLTKLNNRYIPR